MSVFAETLIDWQQKFGRRHLPWQASKDPYGVWVSEIMLQQTQVAAVIPYYLRFMAAFPTVLALAAASVDDVLGHWSGLGYYARGRNLHRAARMIRDELAGRCPQTREGWHALPGIGRSTAAAIMALSTGAREAILDGNVKRVLCRSHGIEGFPGMPAVEKQLWDLAESLLPTKNLGVYTQALMDLGATICTRAKPKCGECPLQHGCVALRTHRVSALPTPRPKKPRPEKASTFWWIENAVGEVWLERRPDTGIWGGLWCCPTENPFAQYEVLGEPIELKHILTHFTWHLTIERVQVGSEAMSSNAGRWFRREALADLGLPKPIRAMAGL